MAVTANRTTLFASMRLPFLVLTPVCVSLALAIALQGGAVVDAMRVALVLIAALAAHSAVNLLNEYHDFVSGLDYRTQRTPFSGGSGALPQAPEAASAVRLAGVAMLLLTLFTGLYLVVTVDTRLLWAGLLGVIIVLTYTPWLNRSAWLCLVAPGTAFGPIMVAGSSLALTGRLEPVAGLLSLLPFFLVNNLLLANQFPDIDADREQGRRHVPIRYGRRVGADIYLAFLGAAALVPIAAVVLLDAPIAVMLCLLPLPAGIGVWRVLRATAAPPAEADNSQALIRALGQNVALTLLSPALLSLALWMA